jgi:hypothetical protein
MILGQVFHRNSGANQDGGEVFNFHGLVIRELRTC